MLRWAISFSIALLTASAVHAQERLTQDEALRLAFPGGDIERRTAYLSSAELTQAQSLAGADADVVQSVVTYYLGRKNGEYLGVAYFDGHVVRSKPEVAMIVIGRDDRITRVEVVRFEEPPEYRARGPWLAQLNGKGLGPDLVVKGSIMNLTGATLTSRALVRASRRVLALHLVIKPFEKPR
jgi:hypothetical protein